MVLIALKDYAKNNHVSYEAIRQQVVRYAGELEGHIIKEGRQQFLDEEAVAFLDAKRKKNPVVIVQQDKDELIELLRQEKEALLKKVAILSDWKADNAMAIAEANYHQQLLEEGKEKIKALEAQNGDLSRERDEALQKAAEAEKTALEASEEFEKSLEAYDRELQEEKQRKISFKEFLQRRKRK